MKKNIQFSLLTLLLMIFCADILQAQQDSSMFLEPEVHLNKNYFKSYFSDSKDVITAPFRWNKKQWLLASGVAGTTVILFTQDKEIHNFFQQNRNNFTDDASKYFFDPLGKGYYSLPLLGALYLKGIFKDDIRAETTALNGVKAFIISGVLTQIIKQVTHRHRPYQDEIPDPRNWDGPISDIDYTSFPSGHTVSGFSIASVLASAYKEKTWVSVLSYSLATLNGLARINDDKHWASDVFMGAVLGIAIGKLVYKNSQKNGGIKIIPSSTQNSVGFSLLIEFR